MDISIVPSNKLEYKHYHKINIFGESRVGKSSLISHMENYDNEIYKIKSNNLDGSQIRQSNDSNKESSLIEQIKRVEISLDENNTLFLSLYETSLDNYDFIKMNLDTLLLHSECIIIMWDKSRNETFDNITNLFYTINQEMKENKFRNEPIFLIQNKKDLDFDLTSSQKTEYKNIIGKEIDEMKENQNQNIIYKEISLLEKDDFKDLLLDINQKLSEYKNGKNLNDDVINNIKINEITKRDNIKFKQNYIKLKGILLGHTAVGKTTFFNYILGVDNSNIISTVGIDSLIINAEVNKENVFFQLYDTAGQEKFRSLPRNYYNQVDGILVFFDVTNEESFKTVDNWIEDIKEFGDMKDFEMILIGNKIDNTEERIISKKQAKEKANKYGIKYFESCCLKGLNIYELLNEIIFEAYNKYYEKISRGEKKIENNLRTKNTAKKRKCC